MHAAHAHAHSNIIPTAGATSPLARGSVEVRLLSGRRAGDYFLGASEGAQQPPQLELGAQLALPALPTRTDSTLRASQVPFARRESGASCCTSTAYLPGVALIAIGTASNVAVILCLAFLWFSPWARQQ